MKDLKKLISKNFILIILSSFMIIALCILSNDTEKSIEKVSKECAEQGYGIASKYTKSGDIYYICKN